MNASEVVQPNHLQRQAVVYVRQSTPHQALTNQESLQMQYGLGQRAVDLGWVPDDVRVVDSDVGRTGSSAKGRRGFQQLVADVTLGKVGIILAYDATRLARNCSDWYRLLDLASLYGALISDASGIFDPRIYDDRLLLGLKGAFSEAQWYSMRTQLCAAQMNKARRGKLHTLCTPGGWQRGFRPRPTGAERHPPGL